MCIIGLHVKYCVYIIIIPYDNIIRLKLAKTRKNSQKLAETRKNSQMDIEIIWTYCTFIGIA